MLASRFQVLNDMEQVAILQKVKFLSIEQAAVLLLAVVVVGIIGCWGKLSVAAVKKAFVGTTVLLFLSCILLGIFKLPLLILLTEEDHLVEWLSAGFLFMTGVIGIILWARGYRHGRPSPTMLLAGSGSLLAFLREIEFGAFFAGQQFWHSRNLFRPKSFLGPEYFEKFRRSLDLQFETSFLYTAHLIFSVVIVGITATVIILILLQRKEFVSEMRTIHREPDGKFFLLGVGVCMFAQLAGNVLHRVIKMPSIIEWSKKHKLSNQFFDEPLDLWGAICVFTSMIVAWQLYRSKDSRQDALEVKSPQPANR